MEMTSVPIILIVCYVFAEIFKVIFKGKEKLFKLIPMLVSILGGILGILIFLTNPELILNATNIWNALLVGIVSGASSTTTNQIVKLVFKKSNEVNNHE